MFVGFSFMGILKCRHRLTDRHAHTCTHRFTSPFGIVVIVWNLCVRMQWVQIPCLAIIFCLGSLCPRAGIAVGLVGSAVGQLGLVGNAVGQLGLVGSEWAWWAVQ